MITLAPDLKASALSLLQGYLPTSVWLAPYVPENFSYNTVPLATHDSVIASDVGYWTTRYYTRDEDITDAVRLLPDLHDSIIGDVPIGDVDYRYGGVAPTLPGDAVFLACEDRFGGLVMHYGCTVSVDGLMAFQNTYTATEHYPYGTPNRVGHEFYVESMNFGLAFDTAYYQTLDISRYGLSANLGPYCMLRIFIALMEKDGGAQRPRLELYAGDPNGDPLSTDFADEPIAAVDFFIPALPSGGELVALQLLEPMQFQVPADTDSLWVRILRQTGDPALWAPVYLRRQSDSFYEAGGGVIIDADGVYSGDYLRLADLRLALPIGELGKPATVGFASPVFSASEIDPTASLLVRREGAQAASVQATTEDVTAIAGVHYVAFDAAISWEANDTPMQLLPITLIPIELQTLDWTEPPAGFGLYPTTGTGSEVLDGTDAEGNSEITMTWVDGSPRRATYVSQQFAAGTPERPFEINFKLKERGSLFRVAVGSGPTDGSASPYMTGLAVDAGGVYAMNGASPVSIDYEAELLTIMAKIDTVSTESGIQSAAFVKLGINGRWVGTDDQALCENVDDVPWQAVGIGENYSQFFICISGETTSDAPSIDVVYWQGSDSELSFTVKLHDAHPKNLLDGEHVVNTAIVSIFRNKLSEIILPPTDDDCLKWYSGGGTQLDVPTNSLEVTTDIGYSDSLALTDGLYIEADIDQTLYLACGSFDSPINAGMVDLSGGKIGFFDISYDLTAEAPARVGFLYNQGGLKVGVNGQWINPDTGALAADPDSVSFKDITGGGSSQNFLFVLIGPATFYAEQNQLHRPANSSAYPFTHFCLGDTGVPAYWWTEVTGATLSDNDFTATPNGGIDNNNRLESSARTGNGYPTEGIYYVESEVNLGDGYATTYFFEAFMYANVVLWSREEFGLSGYVALDSGYSSNFAFPDPSTAPSTESIRFGIVVDFDNQQFKIGFSVNGVMNWIINGDGASDATFTTNYESAPWTPRVRSDNSVSNYFVWLWADNNHPIDETHSFSIIPYADDQRYRPAGVEAALPGSNASG
ncbi:hypothetical protein [Solimonas marina]|uniref:Calx-beta domain-containing protein n=1 Tax=Solimonas marina TaxID=2714601 RepID=A0A969W8P5_9GAMM|nr:hypothetical protein [Solimonas marina]NKF21574.1 hypothetical protein [Solimonas marina]